MKTNETEKKILRQKLLHLSKYCDWRAKGRVSYIITLRNTGHLIR
jgi:hypothetical protein